MKVKQSSRITALILALLMILPLVSVPAFAEEVNTPVGEVLYSNDFEQYTAGQTLSASDFGVTLPTSVTPVSKDGDIALQLDWTGEKGKGNIDANLQLKTPEMSYATYPIISVTANYWFSSDVAGSVTVQFRSYTSDQTKNKVSGCDGNWLNLYNIVPATGKIDVVSGTDITGAFELNTWTEITTVLDLRSGIFNVYVNDEYATVGYANDASIVQTNINIPANKFIVAKPAATAAGTFAIDDVTITSTPDAALYLYKEDFDDATATGDVLSSHSSADLTSLVANSDGKALAHQIQGYDDGNYYVVYTNTTKAPVKITDPVVDASTGLLSGSVTIDSTTYALSDCTINTTGRSSVAKTADGTIADWYVTTSKYRDEFYGGMNVADYGMSLNTPAIDTTNLDYVTFSAKYCFTEDTATCEIQGRLRANSNKALDLFKLAVDANRNVTVSYHSDAKGVVSTTTAKKTVGNWFQVDVVVKTNIALIAIYVDQTLIATVKDNDPASITAFDLGGWECSIISRNYNAGNLNGYLYVDDAAVYPYSLYPSMTNDDGSKSYNFDSLDTGVLSKANGSGYEPDSDPTSAEKNAPYFTVVEDTESTNKYLHMPFWGSYTSSSAYTGNSDMYYRVYHRGYTPVDGTIEINFSIYPVNKTGATSKTQFRMQTMYSAETTSALSWQSMLDLSVNKSNCTITNLSGVSGVAPTLNTWNDISIKFDLVSGICEVYVNGAYAGYKDFGNGNIIIPENQIRLNNMVKSTSYSTDMDAANYIDLDNISIKVCDDDLSNAGERAAYTQVTPYNSVLTEEQDGVEVAYLHIPFIETTAATNKDKFVKVTHTALSTTDLTVIEFQLRPNYNETVAGAPRVEFQFANYSFTDAEGTAHANGQYYSFGQYELHTGDKNSSYGTKLGAAGLLNNTWNTVKLVFNPANGSNMTYINGNLYAYNTAYTAQYYGVTNEETGTKGWIPCQNSTGFTVDANQLLVKLNKVTGYATDAAATDYSYIDIDNFSFSTVTLADVYADLIQTEDGASIRVSAGAEANDIGTPTQAGIRFATEIDTDLLTVLSAWYGAEKVAIGTLIAPSDYLVDADGAAVALTKELGDGNFLDVQATQGKYFNFDNDDSTTHFVGSIVNVFDHNIARDFTARGYVEITLASGETVVIYSESVAERCVAYVASMAVGGYEGDAATLLQGWADRLDATHTH
ncbi:MAG: hypothetical protein IJW92_05000 [Clostridia bacterium]|nr:hypothetical protein [Clostridia bacterium]